MSKLNLTEEELKKLVEAISAGVEPPPELAGKLFPDLMEKLGQEGRFDFETLNRIRIPTIEYAGKRSEGVILASAAALGQSAPLQVVRSFGEPCEDGWRNLIVQGDNLQFLKTVYLNLDPLIKNKVKGKVKLVYIDPPFATKSEFQNSDGTRSYSDKIASAEFLENLRERIIFLRELLDIDGSIYIHLDWRKVHQVKLIMDEVFGGQNLQNQIIWQRTDPHNDAVSRYGRIHDTILWYSFSNKPIYNHDEISEKISKSAEKEYSLIRLESGEIVDWEPELDDKGVRFKLENFTVKGKNPNRQFSWRGAKPSSKRVWSAESPEEMDRLLEKGILYLRKPNKGSARCLVREYEKSQKKGQLVQDIWLNQGRMKGGSEYPTQKPEILLERIIKASSKPGDLILDVFSGSGTTSVVAEKLGRRWITCDFGKHAIYTMQKRMLRIAESKAFDSPKKDAKYDQPPKPFAVASVGAYDFSRIMNLRENKCAYVSFVLALFGIPKEKKNYIAKYKLDHIYAERDGDPVEIFPVWDDQYLYKVRIDPEYLQDIIIQSRGRLKGNYYIVVPESCTRVSDMKLPNGSGGEVHFRFLKFPYSILEQASRNFAIEEQPDTPANINNLVSSVGFYFNDEVTVKIAKTGKGLKIVDFKTPILDREGAAYEGLAGLSLLLVDIDYNGEVFDMEHAIYAKDIPSDGEIALGGVSSITAVIAVDRHGNESKPTRISE